MIIEVDGVGKCDVLADVWYTLPDWINHKSVHVGIIEYTNECGERKQVMGICTSENITYDMKVIIAGGVPCHVVIR